MNDNNRTQLFDNWADRYDPARINRFPFIGYDQVLQTILRESGAEPGASILDVGIGTGNLASLFAELGCVVAGVDFSPAMLARAGERLPEATLVQADLTSQEFPSELHRRFDRIVSAYTFHEFNDVGKVNLLKRLANDHLADEGKIVIGDIAFGSVALRDAGRIEWEKLWDDDEFYWAADEIIPSCRAAGLNAEFIPVSECGGVFVVSCVVE